LKKAEKQIALLTKPYLQLSNTVKTKKANKSNIYKKLNDETEKLKKSNNMQKQR
jgi:hypothetical protein